jgi:hypothetical protein
MLPSDFGLQFLQYRPAYFLSRELGRNCRLAGLRRTTGLFVPEVHESSNAL